MKKMPMAAIAVAGVFLLVAVPVFAETTILARVEMHVPEEAFADKLIADLFAHAIAQALVAKANEHPCLVNTEQGLGGVAYAVISVASKEEGAIAFEIVTEDCPKP